MYTDHFGLKSAPFAIEPDPHFVVLGEDHQEALSTLIYAIEQREGWALMLGQAGTGKTTLVTALMQELPGEVISAVITDPRVTPLDFYNLLAMELGMDGPYPSQGEFIASFANYLIDCRREGKTLLIVVDDAHAASMEVLGGLRQLGNQDNGAQRVLNIFLAAQPGLLELLKKAKLTDLLQRMRRHHKLRALTQDETADYVRHRLKTAGAKKGIFAPEALKQLYQSSGGNCRLINCICDEAMLLAYSQGLTSISAQLIIQAAANDPEKRLMAQVKAQPPVEEPRTTLELDPQPEPVRAEPAAQTAKRAERPNLPRYSPTPTAVEPTAPLSQKDTTGSDKLVSKEPQGPARVVLEPEPALPAPLEAEIADKGAAIDERARRLPEEPEPLYEPDGLPKNVIELTEAQIVSRPPAAPKPASALKSQAILEPEPDEYDDGGYSVDEFDPTEYLEMDQGLDSDRNRLFSRRFVAIAAGFLLFCVVGGATFLGFGGLNYLKRAWWSMSQDQLIVVPETGPAAVQETGDAVEEIKRPPDWGPTIYAPLPNARAQGGSHG
jgi:general secretion pathway protein A